jgi:uncharacterized protein YodC (DUF2158 family)
MIKLGDMVITTSGGNKMKVISINDKVVKCGWICDIYKEKHFDIIDLILYENYIMAHDRQETINNIINDMS